MDKSVLFSDVNSIELHYYFNDNSHTMDAVAFNKCEYYFLAIIKELATKLRIDVEIETEPLKDGGLRSWLKIKPKTISIANTTTLNQKIRIGFLIYLTTTVLCTPLTTTLDVITRKALDCTFENSQIKELKQEKEKAQLKYDIEKLHCETKALCNTIDENIIKKKRSNYYYTVNQYKKVKKVSFSIANEKKQITKEHKIARASFNEYILTTDNIAPIYDENAVIEIISPVLKKGNYKWIGIYNGEVIQFYMKSIEFKTLIQTGKIEFKNGSSIICHLITAYSVLFPFTNSGDIRSLLIQH